MPKLTDYELERQANIERNKALLQAIGIYHAEVAPSREAERVKAKSREKELKKEREKEKHANAAKRRARLSESSAYTSAHDSELPRRKSARLASSLYSSTRGNGNDSGLLRRPDMSSDPIDFLSHPGPSNSSSSSPKAKPREVVLRRLSPPRWEEETESELGTELDDSYRAPLPTRDIHGTLHFSDRPQFTPNLTPEEMFRAGSFGGTAFAEHHSTLLNCTLPSTDYTEFPSSWFTGLDVSTYLTRPESMYDCQTNRYGVRAGQTLKEWERAGWVHVQDPRGWVQWYARFYLGRRSGDDERQIKRWLGVCGPSGRFKRGLVKKIVQKGADWDDETVSPILRQTLQHWAYRLTERDYRAYI